MKAFQGLSRSGRGSLLWIGKSPFRKFHKRKNWYIEIFAFNTPNAYKLKDEDICFQTTKSSGPGGQHANKTESAVRAIHKKSGLSICIQDSRSQFQNKKIATNKLKEIFDQHQIKLLQNIIIEQWKHSINIQRSNPR